MTRGPIRRPAAAAATLPEWEEISTPNWDSAEPALVVASDGTATAVWRRGITPGTRLIETSRFDGETWEAPTALTPASNSVGNPHLAVDADGAVIAIWDRADANNYWIESRRFANGVWGPQQ